MKRIIAFFIAVVTVVLTIPINASAAVAGFYTYEVNNGKATITKVDKSISGDVVIPDKLGGYPVKSIGSYAFSGCNSLTSITIPGNVTGFGNYAFYDCDSLTSVTIDNGVMVIGNYAFYDCDSLTSITIGNNVTSIGQGAFEYCTSLKNVYITDLAAWCRISFKTFYANPLCQAGKLYLNGKIVTDLVIPDSVTGIAINAFAGCNSLTSVTIPDSVISISDFAFTSCTNIKTVTIPNNVMVISTDAFVDCSNFKIRCYKGSYAHAYATSKSLPYELISCTHPATKVENKTSATCTADGYSGDTVCTTCGDTVKKGTTIPKSHKEGSWKIIKQPTATSTGLRTKSCTVCGTEVRRETMPKADHTHTAGAWIIITHPTEFTTGLRTKSCTVCGMEMDSEVIPAAVVPDNTTTATTQEPPEDTPEETTEAVTEVPTETAKPEDDTVTGTEGYFTYSVKDGKATVTDVDTAINGDVTVPDTLGGSTVTAIGNNAFASCGGLTGVIIPESIATIGHKAFQKCPSLSSVVISNDEIKIGNDVFSGCDRLAIYGNTESAASVYAEKHNIPFGIIGEKLPSWEDVDKERPSLSLKGSPESDSDYTVVYILVGVVVLISAAAVIIVLVIRKKSSKAKDTSENDSDEALTTFMDSDSDK